MGCNSEQKNCKVPSINSNSCSSSISKAELELNQNAGIGKDDLIVFYGDNPEYYKNDQIIPIDGASPILKDHMLYLPLEFVFKIFNLSGYSTLIDTGKWENNFGDMFIYDTQSEETKSILIRWNVFDFITNQKSKDTVAWEYGKIYNYNGTIYISADLLDGIPATRAENKIERHHAKYFQNAEMLVIYSGITPKINFYKYISTEKSEKLWEEIYSDIENGTDPIGQPYFLDMTKINETNPYAAKIGGYSLYDFNKDGIPELLIQMISSGDNYIEVFTVENGFSKYLGDIVGSSVFMAEDMPNAHSVIVEKSTEYILANFDFYPYTYMLKDGEFKMSTDYVEFGEVPNSYGGSDTTPISYNKEDVWELNVYNNIEEAIAAYPNEEYNQ